MLGFRIIKVHMLLLFVVGLACVNIIYVHHTMISWYESPTLRKESSWLDVSASRENIGKLSKEVTRYLKTKESQKDLKNMTMPINNTMITNFKITSNITKQKVGRIESTQKQKTINNDITVSENLVTNASSILEAQILKVIKSITVSSGETAMPLCDKNPPDLGPIQVNKTELELDFMEKKFPEVHWGGRYFPPNCTARHKVAIIVPYRDRPQHLPVFLNHMHPFLMKQQIEYGIFIVEQDGKDKFNRAKLMNVGFVEAQRLKAGGWQCFIFHDIDLLPLDTRNMYSCPRQPRHMSVSIDKWNFKLPYEEIFGGVSAVTLEQFTKLNGFSNKYWGWGGEDDDMFYRLTKQNYHIGRYKMSIARYAMLDHEKSVPNRQRYELLSKTNDTFQNDGLSTLKYELVQVKEYHLYTHVLVNITDTYERSWWMYLVELLRRIDDAW